MKVFIFDFDGTITVQDTTDLILEMPAEDQIWRIENDWKEGKITSYQCMKAQTKFLRGLSIADVHQHLKQHNQIDPHFSELVHFLKHEQFHVLILSEGYDLSIRFHEVQQQIEEIYSSKLLTENGTLTGELEVLNDRLWHYNAKCIGCCICKVDFLRQLSKRCNMTKSFAIGDGASDACLFQFVDVSFSLNPNYKATYHVKDLAEVVNILTTNIKP